MSTEYPEWIERLAGGMTEAVESLRADQPAWMRDLDDLTGAPAPRPAGHLATPAEKRAAFRRYQELRAGFYEGRIEGHELPGMLASGAPGDARSLIVRHIFGA